MQILKDLIRTEKEVLEYFSLSAEQLNQSYGPGKWNVKQILHHIADAESVLYDRIRRAISSYHESTSEIQQCIAYRAYICKR